MGSCLSREVLGLLQSLPSWDNDQMKQGLRKLRLSIDAGKPRIKLNPMIRDVTWYRLEKDILAASDTQGSVMESGGFKGPTGRRPPPAFSPNKSGGMGMMSGAQTLVMDAPPGSK